MDEFPNLQTMRVLDLGGTASYWRRAPVRPRHVTVINLGVPTENAPWVRHVRGNACRATKLVDETYDVVISNSLLEHLGGHRARTLFAQEVLAFDTRYWIQTPYRYFPIEPHWVLPAQQFLPVSARAWLAPRWPLGHTYGWGRNEALEEVLSTELVGATEMRAYFPEARLRWERIAGLPKSVIAIR